MGRATLDGDLDALVAGNDALPESDALASSYGRSQVHWRGAGGRWLVWVGRAIAWAVIILIGYRGVLAIVEGQGRASGPPAKAASTAATSRFPATLAEAFALQFGDAYLNFSPATAAERARTLARFRPAGSDSQFGWSGTGTQRLISEQVAGISVTGAHTAVVTLLGQLGSGRLIELGVPIYAASGGMVVSAEPSLLPAPATVAAPHVDQAGGDRATQAALASQLPAFFQAYASGDKATLARFEWPGSHITGLAGAVTFRSIDSVYAPTGGPRRQAVVTVTWDLPSAVRPRAATATVPATLQMTYLLTVVRQGSSWDVQAIGPSTQGPP